MKKTFQAPYLKIYDTYSNNYDESLATLKECMKKESFNNFLDVCELFLYLQIITFSY
jgi:hypothetical protein